MTINKVSERVQIKTDEDDISVYANILSGNDQADYSPEWLLQQLDLQGYSGLNVVMSAHKEIEELLSNNGVGKVILGKKIDAKVVVSIASDSLSAKLSITAAKGGNQVGTKDIVVALHDQGIDLTLVNKQVVAALMRKSLKSEPGDMIEHVIAEGLAPVHGKDTQFKCLLDNLMERNPHERSDGSLDYYDLGELLCVGVGCELMRKYAPTPATNGKSVTGKALPARLGKMQGFKKCKGAEPSLSDSDLLISTIKGQPIAIKQGINVEDLYTVKNVDLHTGHVNYDGSIIVEGDVVSGMKIKVSGDVQVFGMVGSACIEAGGNIDIKLGAIGHAMTENQNNKLQLVCKGNLSAGHLENAVVDVQGDILIKSRISNCEIKAGQQIVVGNNKEKKSGIVGGSVMAGSLIRVESLGSSGGTLTHVSIECGKDTLERIETVKKDIVDSDQLLVKKLGLMVSLSKKHTEEAQQSLKVGKQETEQLKVDIRDLMILRDKLELLVEETAKGKIIVQREVFPSVVVKILDQETEVESGYGKGVFSLNMQAISFGV